MSANGDIDRRLAVWLAEEAPARAPDRLRTAIEQRLDRTPQRGFLAGLSIMLPTSRPWIPAAVLAALLIAGVGAAVWLAGSRPPVVRPITLTAILQPSGGATFRDVAVSGAGLVAVGTLGADADQAAAAWSSADGVTWSSVPGIAAAGRRSLGPLVAGAATPVAIGLLCEGAHGSCDLARVSFTDGGSQWDPLRWIAASPTYGVPTTGGSGYGFEVNAAATDGGTSVMVGWAASRDGPTPIGPAVATSADGLTWTWRILADGPPTGSAMSGVASGGHGFVAVGTGPSVGPAVWISSDGSSWQQVPAATAPTTGELEDIAAGAGGYVAVGRIGTHVAAWRSTDGLTWRPAPSGAALAEGNLTRVTWTGSAFLAVGRNSAGDGAAWTSADGSSWTRLDASGVFAGMPIVGGTAVGSRLTLFGQDPAGQLRVGQQGG